MITQILVLAASLFTTLGEGISTFCIFNVWLYEPEMSEELKAEILKP